MKFTEFKKSLSDKEEFAVYLFEGKDAFFLSRGVSAIKDKFLVEPELNYCEFVGNFDNNDVLSSLSSFPFLGNKRITVVKEFYPDKAFIVKNVLPFAENMDNSGILVVVNTKPSEFSKLKNVCVVDCNKADEDTIVRWIKAKCKSMSCSITDGGALLLANNCLSDMKRIETETEKLIDYIDGGTITEKDVSLMVNQDAEYKIYEMTNFIGLKQFDNALLILKELLDKGYGNTFVLSGIYNYYRKMLHVAISDKSDGELAKIFSNQEYAITKIRKQSKSFNKKSIKKAIDFLEDNDYKSKSGLIGDNEGFWLSVFKIMVE